MILAIIGKCVIVMNKHYWNEFSSQYIDKDTEKKILKIYQYSLPKTKINTSSNIEINQLRTPDITIDKVDVKLVQSVQIKRIFFQIKKYVNTNDYILCFPVIAVSEAIDSLNPGIYMFDISKASIVKISNEVIFTEETQKIHVFWLLDLENALIVYGRAAFYQGIKHTMNVREKVYVGTKKEPLPLFNNQQKILKTIGINPRLALLIECDSIMEK